MQASDTALGLVSGLAFVLFYAILGVPIAWAADRWSRRNIVAAGLAFWSLMTGAHRLRRQYLAAGAGALPDGGGRGLLHAALQLDDLGPVQEGAAAARSGHIRHRQLDRLRRPVPDRGLDRRHITAGAPCSWRRARPASCWLCSSVSPCGSRCAAHPTNDRRVPSRTGPRDGPLPRRIADLPVHSRRRHLHGREYLRRRRVDADLPCPCPRP